MKLFTFCNACGLLKYKTDPKKRQEDRQTDNPEVTAVEEEGDEEEDETATEEPAVLMGVAIDVTMVTRVGAEPTEDDVYKMKTRLLQIQPISISVFRDFVK